MDGQTSAALDAAELNVTATAPCEWLIDNADAYTALLGAIDSALHTIWIMQLAFDADCIAYDDESSTRSVIVDALAAAAQDRGVQVRVLLNESRLLDTARPLRRFFAAAGIGGIVVRGVDHWPQLLHAKMLIVDRETAFLIGSPFVNGYWDDDSHAPSDARRPMRELGGRPLHDLSMRLGGRQVRDLEHLFADLWNVAGPRDLSADVVVATETDSSAAAASDAMRIITTVPKGLLSEEPGGRTDILPACIDAIAGAHRLIYIEHQYLSAAVIVNALAGALERAPDLEIIVVLNQNPDVTAYRKWQSTRLKDAGLLNHPRVGLFSLWTSTRTDNYSPTVLSQIFVHSKLLLVDDECAIAGSSNMDGVSLLSYGEDFEGRLGRWVFDGVRNVDVAVVLDGSVDFDCRTSITDLRRRLWSEHLGSAFDAESGQRPRDGWLALWRRVAARNAKTLNEGDPAGRVLCYSTRATPVQQLKEIGIEDVTTLDVRFKPSWMEVNFSPNWIRNMFS